MHKKLIDLLTKAKNLSTLGREVDYLIANGVIVGKPLTEYLHPVDNYAGLKDKYLVFKSDTGERVENCFVLRPDKDKAAVEALRAYANATDNKTLSKDIYNWVGEGVTGQEWISVYEPPKERGIYQVFLWDKEMGRSKVWYGQFTGYNWSVYDIYGDGMRCEVTHWMPLPEPPKE